METVYSSEDCKSVRQKMTVRGPCLVPWKVLRGMSKQMQGSSGGQNIQVAKNSTIR